MDLITDFNDFQFAIFFDFFAICHFFHWGYVKILVYVFLLPANREELEQRITTALQTVAQDMLQRVWEELENRIDVCRVSGGAHIEHPRNPLINPRIY